MATVLTSSTKTFGGVPFPTEDAFKWCFALGAAAAFAGVAIAAFVPRRDDAGTEEGAADTDTADTAAPDAVAADV
jgi:hypothetical protein